MSEETSDLSRRDLLRTISITLTTTGAGVVTLEAAQHVHAAVAQQKAAAKSDYHPKYFTAHEYQTLRRLADLIVPADEHSKGALDAGATEFIDYLSSQSKDLADIYTGGLAWLDIEMQRRYGAAFVDAKPVEQTAMLDLIAYRRNESPELAPGIRFFAWTRNMVVDAFYTSPVGVKDLGYMGNTAVSEFSVPAEALEYALKRSPFA
jgi:gluconate 2-dehydrogenase gamma chain